MAMAVYFQFLACSGVWDVKSYLDMASDPQLDHELELFTIEYFSSFSAFHVYSMIYYLPDIHIIQYTTERSIYKGEALIKETHGKI
jgi:hypothetical protein